MRTGERIFTSLLPPETLLGLATGRYTQHGGVIRYAAGSDHGGQILQHMLMPAHASGLPSLANSLAPTLAQVVQALRDRATATARPLMGDDVTAGANGSVARAQVGV